MEKEVYQKYIKAGKILHSVRENAKKWIKPEMKLLNIAEKIEEEIKKEGGKPAFPVTTSLNEFAAHYTPEADEKNIFKETDLLKVDLGVHIDGYIADSAFSLNPANNYSKLIEASSEALENVKSILEVGVSLRKIGQTIEKTIKSKGFSPVANLSGHFLEEYLTHAAPSIPNVDIKQEFKIEEGAFAIEPFATSGLGYIKEYGRVDIFSLEYLKPIRNTNARKILMFVEENYQTLPFAERWLNLGMTKLAKDFALRELINNGNMHQYPVLKESEPVSQEEESFLVYNEEIIQFT